NNSAAAGSVGIWRFDGVSWLNLTSLVSTTRATVAGQAPFATPVNTPGPDDDYRITFPQQNAAWSDLALVSKPGDPTRVLYAALGYNSGIAPAIAGTFGGAYENGVYRLINPQNVVGGNVRWLVGDPTGGPDNRGATAFPTGPWRNGLRDFGVPPQPPTWMPRNGIIKLTAT